MLVDDTIRIRELIEKLNYYTKLYDEGNPEISDQEWDSMYFELVQLERITEMYFKDSPTQRVNYDVKNQLDKVKHSHPMLSLDKTKDIEEVKKFLNKREYFAMAKLDGLTCSLTYRGGRLVGAETRGNGEIGEDVLHNAYVVKNIPKRIAYEDEYVIDGEIICTYKDFEQFKNEYKNPRNFAAGSIRLLDSNECAKRNLSFIAWDVITGTEKTTLVEKIKEAQSYGFTTAPGIINDEFNSGKIEVIKNHCEEKGYPIDGIVIKYNKVSEYEAAGRTDHHFKGGIAYKFYDETEETIITDIEWTMGRTGQLTPVAILRPVELDGSEISRASLHNISIMKSLGIEYSGQAVEIFKANMIIPQIKRVLPKLRTMEYKDTFKIPDVCPVCGGTTEIRKDNDSEVLYCTNPGCEGQLVNRFDHFAGKKGLDIKGFSKATIEKLMDWGWLEDYEDIFTLTLHRDEWIRKPGFGVASVDKILNAIEASKNTSLDKVIAAAGIPEIGSRVAKDLAKHYDSWADFRTEDNFLQYDGIGAIMNDNILSFDYDDLKLDTVVNQYLTIWTETSTNTDTQYINIAGKSFCITGKVNLFKNRAALQADIESKGGKAVSSVSTKTDYLINNDINSTSSKNIKAKSLGIPIITEEDYMKLIGE